MKQPECRRCGDTHYVTSGDERYATARVCECSSPCPSCQGARQRIERRPDGRTWAVPCHCISLEVRIQRFNAAQIPAYFHSKDTEKFQAKSADEKVAKRWSQTFQDGGKLGDRGFLFVGNPGVGKTHLLCAILRHLTLERGIACQYVDSFQLIHDLKLFFGEEKNASSALLEAVCRVPVLALDELGKTRPDGWQREVLDTIVSRRYDAGLTTFAASNYPLPKEGPSLAGGPSRFAQVPAVTEGTADPMSQRETLDRRVGPRVFSRLMERCRAFALNGDDRRLAMASRS